MKAMSQIVRLAVLVALTLGGVSTQPLAASIVDINGGSSWNGWNYVSDAQTSGVWVRGNANRTYNIYRTDFVLQAGQTVSGSRIANGVAGNGVGYTGNDAASLFTGSWQAGDRIIGIGLDATGSTLLNGLFFHIDFAGNNIMAASSFGAADGSYSADAGDVSAYSPGSSTGDRYSFSAYSIFTAFTPDGSTNFIRPYGVGAGVALNTPGRAFAILDNGSMNMATSGQYFMNLDAMMRANGGAGFGEGNYSSQTKIGFYEFAPNGNFSQQVLDASAVPEPASVVMWSACLLAGVGLVLKRRRR